MSVKVEEGDPGRLAYFDNPNYTVTPMTEMRTMTVDPRACPGCMFEAPSDSRKWYHTFDSRCRFQPQTGKERAA